MFELGCGTRALCALKQSSPSSFAGRSSLLSLRTPSEVARSPSHLATLSHFGFVVFAGGAGGLNHEIRVLDAESGQYLNFSGFHGVRIGFDFVVETNCM
jgi:hypothetical protein